MIGRRQFCVEPGEGIPETESRKGKGVLVRKGVLLVIIILL